MNALSATPNRQLAASPATFTTLSRSSGKPADGQGAGHTPLPPRCILPDSYWLQAVELRTTSWHRPESDYNSGLVTAHLSISGEGQARIAALLEKTDADRGNDPLSRAGDSKLLDTTLFQPGRFELSPKTLAGLIVWKDPGADAPASTLAACSAGASTAAATQLDIAASGCCLPPSCVIL